MSKLVYALEAADQHWFPRHPECPARMHAVEQALQRLKVFEGCTAGQVVKLTEYLPLPQDLLHSVHSPAHVDSLRATSASVSEPTAVRDPDDPDGPTFATPTSYQDALCAACAAVALVDAVLASGSSHPGSGGGSSLHAGEVTSSSSSSSPAQACDPELVTATAAASGFSICRPPGHHATPDDQMGFCLLNNAVLAARHAQRRYGLNRVLILDWDVHHGNGTQDCCYQDPSIMLIDMHQQDVWPGTGGLQETGSGPGTGTTINVPLPWHSGHVAAQLAFHQVVAPAARRFRPDLIIVSAGYDAHWQDPLEHLQFQPATYYCLTEAVMKVAEELCGGRLLLLLEGGYNQEALGDSVAASVLALLGKEASGLPDLLPPEKLPHPEPLDQVASLIQELKGLHSL